MKPELMRCEDLRAIGYELTEAEYLPGSQCNGAYWSEVNFRDRPPYPAAMKDLGEVATWKHPAGEKEKLAYYFGCATDFQGVPEGFVAFILPGGEYARYLASDQVGKEAVNETVRKVRETAKAAMESLDSNGLAYDLDHGMMYELYRDANAYVYVPVKQK